MIADEERLIEYAEGRTLNMSSAKRQRYAEIEEDDEKNGRYQFSQV